MLDLLEREWKSQLGSIFKPFPVIWQKTVVYDPITFRYVSVSVSVSITDIPDKFSNEVILMATVVMPEPCDSVLSLLTKGKYEESPQPH